MKSLYFEYMFNGWNCNIDGYSYKFSTKGMCERFAKRNGFKPVFITI